MSNLITLQCPNCGGKLDVGPNTISLKCQYCGMEHMVRQMANGFILEAYARCPVCNRNDRAEKVSAILRSQTQNIQGTTYQKQASVRQVGNTLQTITEQVAIPVQSSQMSELARHLAAPVRPKKKSAPDIAGKSTHYVLIGTIVFILLGLCSLSCTITYLVNSYTTLEILVASVVALVSVAIVVRCVSFGIPNERKRNAQKKVDAEQKRQAFLLQEQNKHKQWEKAMERWNKLYYCGRDDCVFLPGTNTSAPITDMYKYLYEP